MKTNLEPGPKRVQSGLKTVQRKLEPGPKQVQCESKHVQTGPKTVQVQFHILEIHLLPHGGRLIRAKIYLKKMWTKFGQSQAHTHKLF